MSACRQCRALQGRAQRVLGAAPQKSGVGALWCMAVGALGGRSLGGSDGPPVGTDALLGPAGVCCTEPTLTQPERGQRGFSISLPGAPGRADRGPPRARNTPAQLASKGRACSSRAPRGYSHLPLVPREFALAAGVGGRRETTSSQRGDALGRI